MNNNTIIEICKKYNLGNQLEPTTPVTGGLIHKTWKIKTDKGQYAIKELDMKILSQPTALEAFELSEVVANKFLQTNVPAIVSLSIDGKHVLSISDSYIMVFNWIEGFTLSTQASSIEQARGIGIAIGNIHKANINEPSVQVGLPQIFGDSHWQELIVKVKTILPEYSDLLENIPTWNQNGNGIIDIVKSNLVVTHGDIDQKNVIWTDEATPNIIDWEGVSKTNPGLEIIDAALNWGGLVSGKINTDSMKAVIEGYKSAGCEISESTDGLLSACIIKWLPWLEFNMRRVLESSEGSELYKLSITQIKLTLKSIDLISKNKSSWKELLD